MIIGLIVLVLVVWLVVNVLQFVIPNSIQGVFLLAVVILVIYYLKDR